MKRGLTLERFGGPPKPAPQQQQRSGVILPPFLLRPGALARRRELAFWAPQKQQRSGSILPYFLLMQAPCSLLATESWLSHQTSAPARYFVAFYAGSSVWAGNVSGFRQTGPPTTTTLPFETSSFLPQAGCSCSPPKARFRQHQRSRSILRCLLRRVVRIGPGAFSSEKSNPRGVSTILRI